MCEAAVGYGGMYDPFYVDLPSGLFATTFDGLKVNKNACSFDASSLSPAPPTIKFFSTIGESSDGAIYAAAADPMDSKIYKSTNGGMTFPVSATPGQLNDWWQSIVVAPSDTNVVYLAGYRLKAGQPKVFLVFRSGDGGQSYQPLPITDLATMPNSTIEIAGVAKTNANTVYARVTLSDNTISDALYRSIDGGQTWSKILEKSASLAFVARANGQLVASTVALGSFVATETGTATLPTFNDLVGAPHINCLAENEAGEVWACTQNFGGPSVPGDGFGIMKSTDLTTWTGVLRYQDISAPVSCADGTPQKDMCDSQLWCGFCSQIGCNANRECATAGDPPPDGPTTGKGGGGCCESGTGAGSLLLGLLVFGVLVRTRKTRVAVVLVGIIGLHASSSEANGRAPATNGVIFHPTDTKTMLVRTTFGPLISHDDGCSFRWVCEQNVGYGGMFDPRYAIATDGTLFATTFNGLRISHDGGCSFVTATAELPVGDPNRIADEWVDGLDIGPTGEVWVTTAESGKSNDIFRSTDNGVTFMSRGMLSTTMWWKSVKVAPSDAKRVYITGYQVAGTASTHLFTSPDDGDSWTEGSLAGVMFGATPIVLVVAVDPTNPLVVYMVSLGSNGRGDRLYRSADGGTSFGEVLATPSAIRDVVVVDANKVIATAGSDGTFESIDGGKTFSALSGAPQLECLGKRADGSLVGCGANWDPDFKAVAQTNDLAQWQKVFRFVELAGPVQCPAGTVGHDMCDQQLWKGLQEQFASTGPIDPACGGMPPVVDGPPEEKSGGGCCDAGAQPSVLLLAAIVFSQFFSSRRRARC